ncbi:hypothetical protein BpHYR1_045557 [Brachionus plicatilis]|uniref:Uncharacterized protein n=1 Tax=Brachionus plicatilis TaxID=10195 RepID=A0A3M7QN26_BRAPC|nr:hypothetical protein BpHYR1_045557 [Brachionus plicatilis]
MSKRVNEIIRIPNPILNMSLKSPYKKSIRNPQEFRRNTNTLKGLAVIGGHLAQIGAQHMVVFRF